MPRITLFGFYNYDPTLFDGIQLPTGCDPQILKDTIIMECGDLYPYYQHPGYLKLNINSWFRRMRPQFQRAFDALAIEYAPNENYDRYEDWEDSREDSRKTTNDSEVKIISEASNSNTATTTSEGTNSNTTTTTSEGTNSNTSTTTTEATNSNTTTTSSEASGTREDKVSAFDSGSYTPKAYTESGNNDESTTTGSASTSEESTATGSGSTSEESTTTGSGSTSEESTTTGSGSTDEESTTTGKDESNESGAGSGKHSGRIHGNIGVTTNATLIREELELRRYDIYLDIARQFQQRFIVEVY